MCLESGYGLAGFSVMLQSWAVDGVGSHLKVSPGKGLLLGSIELLAEITSLWLQD